MLDDNGTNTNFIIPNVYYNTNAPYRIFSPQHAEQELKRVDPTQVLSTTTHFDQVIIALDDGRKTKTIQLDPFSNVALTQSSPGYQKLALYCTQTTVDENLIAFPASCFASAHPSHRESPIRSCGLRFITRRRWTPTAFPTIPTFKIARRRSIKCTCHRRDSAVSMTT
jgi:hypothetical protein